MTKVELSKLDMDQAETSNPDGDMTSICIYTKYNDKSVYKYSISSKDEISNERYWDWIAFSFKKGADVEAVTSSLRYLAKLCGG